MEERGHLNQIYTKILLHLGNYNKFQYGILKQFFSHVPRLFGYN